MTSIGEESHHTDLLEAWSSFTSTDGDNQHIGPVTLASWKRCVDLGIDPEELTYRFLSEEELKQRQEANADLIEAAAPYMEHLSLTLSGKPHVVALADLEGWIIAMSGTPEAFGGESAGIWIGSSWAERHIGNNGIGTALCLEEPVLIYGVEHYAQAYHPATCLGVPIRAGDVLRGALDVSVLNEDADPARLMLAQACVASIETTLSNQFPSTSAPSDDEHVAAVEELIATTVHDLKSPLTAIQGISQLGASTASDDRTREYFNKLQQQVDRLNEMVEGLLQRGNRSRVIANPGSILEDVLDEIAPVCRDKGISVDCIVEGTSSASLEPNLFRRALQNIVNNAVESMDNGGALTARAANRGDKIRISISDTGSGIPPNIQPHVFEPYLGGRPDGTGLGLSMAHQTITETHQGSIWFTTEDGKGTTFYIEIPALSD